MGGRRYQVRQWFVAGFLLLTVATRSLATPAIDVSVNAFPSDAGLFVGTSAFQAQTFTVGADGLLSSIDLQIEKDVGRTGELRVEIRPLFRRCSYDHR